MLLAGWEVHIGKNCDHLENAARGHALDSIFKPEVTVFPIRADPKPANNVFIFFSCGKLSYKWVLDKERCIKEQIYF